MNVFTTLPELQDLVRRGAMGTILVVTAQALLLFIYFSAVLTRIERKLDTMVTRAEFDAALTTGIATINKGFADLQAKIDAGTIVTPEDFSAELATLQSGVSTALTLDPTAGDAPAA